MIKDDNKVILLTIFLYIVLNFRKFEKLIQCVNNNESFTISRKDNNRNILSIIIAKICCVFLGLFITRNIDGGVLGFQDMPYIIIFMFLILLIILMMASIALGTSQNDEWAQSLDAIMNEILYGLVIYFIISNLLLTQVDMTDVEEGQIEDASNTIQEALRLRRKNNQENV